MKFKVAVLHKFQFNMYPKRVTAFERNYMKYVSIAEKTMYPLCRGFSMRLIAS